MTSKCRGRCLCGKVTFSVAGDLEGVTACHCGQCRQWSGHFWASADCKKDDLKIETGDDLITWHESSTFARRAFCCACGSSLFYHAHGKEEWKHVISISAGCLEAPTGLDVAEHIYVRDKGDYYELLDDLPKKERE